MNRPPSLSLFNEKISLLSTKVPFTYYGIIKRQLGSNQTILDLGCGNGALMYVFNRQGRYKVIGVDIHQPYVEQARQLGIYDRVIKSDIGRITFPAHSFDVVLLNHVIEHLKKEEGFKLLDKLEKIAKKKVLLVTPIGFLSQDEYGGNPHQQHQSAWWPEDFLKRSYRVIGQGWSIFHGHKLLKKFCHNIGPFNHIFFAVSTLLQPFLKKRYGHCYQMICLKEIRK